MKLIQSINPFSGEILQEYQPHSETAIQSALDLSREAFSSWKKSAPKDRAKLLKKAGEILRENKGHYASLISLEMGKVLKESISEVEKCAWVCDFYAEKGEEFLQEELIDLPEHKKAKILFQPLGTILAVMPWNFPFWQVFRFAAPTLMAGNTALLKHASNVPQCSLAIAEVFEKAGFPKGTFQSLLIDAKATTKLLENPTVKAVSLTGSEGAGAAIASVAGKEIKKSLLELGGSDPFIVLADADITKAAEVAAKARMINFGQSCIAAKRFIIEEKVYEEFLDKFTSAIKSMKMGDPMEDTSDYACMARPDLAMELYEQVQKSVDLGAKVILGGDKPKNGSAIFSPTILTEIPRLAPAFSEELFGPVACIFRVKNVAEALELANATEFGLGASLWTSDLKKGEQIASEIESGAVFLNSMVASHPYLPFGGIKKSGFGRELGKHGIHEFVNAKTVYLG